MAWEVVVEAEAGVVVVLAPVTATPGAGAVLEAVAPAATASLQEGCWLSTFSQ